MFQTFRGSPALSEFRIQGLMQKFQQNQLPVKSVYAEYLHFVELNRPLVSEQEAKLKALLHYGPTLAEHDAKGETFIVIPRVGTISSWSSKATDIAHNCGLSEVERIERGLAYYFELSQPLDEKTTEKFIFDIVDGKGNHIECDKDVDNNFTIHPYYGSKGDPKGNGEVLKDHYIGKYMISRLSINDENWFLLRDYNDKSSVYVVQYIKYNDEKNNN